MQISSNCLSDCLPWKLKLKATPFSLLALTCAYRWLEVMKLSAVILCWNGTCKFFYQISKLPRVPDDRMMLLGLQSVNLLKHKDGSKHRNSNYPFRILAVNFWNSSPLLEVLYIFSIKSITNCTFSQVCSFLWNSFITFLPFEQK
jgi:hypothetical protein